MKIEFALDDLVCVDSYELTARLAKENSDDQAEFLNQFFENLAYQCKEQFLYESQLAFISKDLNKATIKALKDILYFRQEE